MKLSVYLGEDEIRAVLGRSRKHVEIADCMMLPLKKGALINDLVVEEEPVKDALLTIRDRFPSCKSRVHLMLDGNEIITKVMTVPGMTRGQLYEIARHELLPLLPDSDTCNYIYDFSIIHKGKNERTILCAAVRRSIMESYKELFLSCGMRLISVGVAIDGFQCLAKRLPVFCGKTCLMVVADGRNLSVFIFSKGIFRHCSRLRLIEERGSRACMGEMEQQVLSMIYLYRMEREEEHSEGPELVCFYGFSDEEMVRMMSVAGQAESVEIIFPGKEGIVCKEQASEYDRRKFPYAACGLMNGGYMNLLAARGYRRFGNPGKVLAGTVAVLLPAALLTGLLAGNASSKREVLKMERQIEKIVLMLEHNDSLYVRARELQKELALLNEYEDGCSYLAERYENEAAVTGRICSAAMEAAAGEIHIESMELKEGGMTVEGYAGSYGDIAGFVDRLAALNEFEQVSYDGFTYYDQASGEEKGCRFTVTYTIKAGSI